MISEFPLFMFTTLAGLSAGFMATRAIFPLSEDGKRPWLSLLVALVLLGAGLLGVLFHLGRPERFINAMMNPVAGIAQEGYTSIVFGLLLLIDLILVWRKGESPRGLQIATGVAGFALTVVMGNAYTAYLGTPAWTSWATVPLFVVGDIAMGGALYGIFAAKAYEKPGYLALMIAAEVVFAVALYFLVLHFANVGLGGGALVFGIVVAGLGAFAATMLVRKRPSLALTYAVLACSVVGVAAARWAFYAAAAL